MARPTLILLHGRSHDPESMHELVRRAGLDGEVDVIAPAAPGGSWYPDRFFEPRSANEPHLSDAVATAGRAIDEAVGRGVAPEWIVLGGFSQGACVACDYLAREPRPLGALAVLCGGLIGEPGEELARPEPGSLESLPVLITATEEDAWVPVEHVRVSAEALEGAGARVDLRVYPPGEHEVHAGEAIALGELVAAIGT